MIFILAVEFAKFLRNAECFEDNNYKASQPAIKSQNILVSVK